MPNNLTDVSSFTSPVVVPLDGELITGADRALTAQSLANRTRYLKDHLWSNAVFRNIKLTDFVPDTTVGAPTQWAFTGAGSLKACWVQNDVSAANILWADLDVPNGVTIEDVTASIDGNGGGAGHGALPATMPTISIHKVLPATGVASASDSATDPSASVVAYQTPHFLQVFTTMVVDDTFRYVVKITGEAGANAVGLALLLSGVQISWTVP